MADSRYGNAYRHHGSTGSGLHPDLLHRRLGLEFADMTKEDTPPPAVIEYWKRRIEEFKVKLEADPDNKIFDFWLACYEGYFAAFSKDTKK